MQAIFASCQAKARIVEADEHEKAQRALLNLGHTFAHAFEAVAGYDGRLLPPWYDEAFAAVMENRLHQLNAVFCRAQAVTGGGTRGARAYKCMNYWFPANGSSSTFDRNASAAGPLPLLPMFFRP